MIIYNEAGDFQGRVEGDTFFTEFNKSEGIPFNGWGLVYPTDVLDILVSEGATKIVAFDIGGQQEWTARIEDFYMRGEARLGLGIIGLQFKYWNTKNG